MLLVAALGLLAYGAYKFVAAIADVENFGHDAKGIGRRIGFLGSSIGHAALAWTAFEFARGTQQAPGGGQSEQTASALLAWELGSLVLGLVGVGFVLASLHQARNAITAGFMRSVGAGAPGWVCWIGRIGHAARAVVFLVIGWSLIRSAWLENGQGVKGLGEALVSLSDQGPLFTVAAAGLVMFGLFSLIVARFQIIPDIDRSDLKPSFR